MIRNYKTEDEDALHSLWNTAGVKKGFAPLSKEKFHKLLTGYPDFSPEYTFVMEERGAVCGFVNGCTGGHIPKGDVRGYFSCLILSAAADTALYHAKRQGRNCYCIETEFHKKGVGV